MSLRISKILNRAKVSSSLFQSKNHNHKSVIIFASVFSESCFSIQKTQARLLITLANTKLRATIISINLSKSWHKTNGSSNGSKFSSTYSKLNEKDNNELTVLKSKRLMRLIYARVHPDLYTNDLQAQVFYLLLN